MGNEDGFISAVKNYGQNEVIEFDGGFFSFAMGNEIALVINDKYFILNCDSKLFEECKKIKKQKKKQIITFWKEKSKDYEISQWSVDFKELR